MYNLVEWSESLDLSLFYSKCKARGFENNSSQKKMIDCFRNEREWNCWILFYNNEPIGSVAAHSFDDVMGPNTYRILARTCSFSNYSPVKGLTTVSRTIIKHQHFTDQFFLPKCLDWAGKGKVFATSNNSQVGSQRLVNNVYFPILEQLQIAKNVDEIYYRGLKQNVWEIFKKPFFDHLNRYPLWKV